MLLKLINFQRENPLISMVIPFVPNLLSVLTAKNVVSDVLRQRALDEMNESGSFEGKWK